MQLDRCGSFSHDRSRFYAAEVVDGIEALHAAGVIHRNLKPEHILIDKDGHIALCGFGKSKAFQRGILAQSASLGGPSEGGAPYWMNGREEFASSLQLDHADTTNSLCGTATYFAPELIMGLPYSYEIDWWSLGTILYEMLTGIVSSSITVLPHENSSSWSFLRQRPFEADNMSIMYDRILNDELQFPEDQLIDRHAKDLIQKVSCCLVLA